MDRPNINFKEKKPPSTSSTAGSYASSAPESGKKSGITGSPRSSVHNSVVHSIDKAGPTNVCAIDIDRSVVQLSQQSVTTITNPYLKKTGPRFASAAASLGMKAPIGAVSFGNCDYINDSVSVSDTISDVTNAAGSSKKSSARSTQSQSSILSTQSQYSARNNTVRSNRNTATSFNNTQSQYSARSNHNTQLARNYRNTQQTAGMGIQSQSRATNSRKI